MRAMLCQCPFHVGAPYVVAYRRDLPTRGKPITDAHGLVCKPCGDRFYHRVTRALAKYPITLEKWMIFVAQGKTVFHGMDLALEYLPFWKIPHAIQFVESFQHRAVA